MTDESTDQAVNTAEQTFSWWKRVAIVLLLVTLASIYPLIMVLSHKVTNVIPGNTPNQVWDDRKVGAAIEVLEREDFYGWAAATPTWHPKARLTAMPAYQQGISSVFSEFAGMRSELSRDEAPDTDLKHAYTLLQELDGKDSADKLHAAIEALRRYHGRKARSLTEDQDPKLVLKQDLALFDTILNSVIARLDAIAAQPSRGVFNRELVTDYYRAKGQIHAIAMLVKATPRENDNIDGFADALDKLNTSLSRATRPAPLTVSNPQPGKFSFGGNDVMQLAYLARKADDDLRQLQSLLNTSSDS